MIKYFLQTIGPSEEKWQRFYYECLLLFNRERSGHISQNTTEVKTIQTKGRQTGGDEWTRTRGEAGS